jgi:ribonuclease HI
MKFKATALDDLETIYPYCIPPWQPRLEATVLDREDATEWAKSAIGVVFTDASYRKGNIGLGVYIRTLRETAVRDAVMSKAIGRSTQISAYYAELLAIDHAAEMIETMTTSLRNIFTPSIIVSDSTSANAAISQPRCQSGQSIIRSIYDRAKRIAERGGPTLPLRWVPAHSDVEGNQKSHDEATAVTSIDLQPVNIAAVSTVTNTMVNGIPTTARERWDIDTALPGKHVRDLYDHRPYKEAAMLCRLRSGVNGLNRYLAKIGKTDSDRCECSDRHEETTRHFLFECTRWEKLRRQLREIGGGRWGDLSHFLGGKSNQNSPSGRTLIGPKEKWKPNLEVVAATVKFALSTGRLS